jgi:predicted amidohydrolase
MKVAAAQISCAPGDFNANIAKIRDFASLAKNSGAELIVFPDMVDTGYSMSVIRRHATSWNEGAVPALQKLAKTLSLPPRRDAARTKHLLRSSISGDVPNFGSRT